MTRPALFLDRDGVINVETNYVHRPDEFIFIDGIFDLCRNAMKAGMAIVVVTNQAGIGRGYYTEEQFHALSHWMCERFEENDVVINGVYYCPFHAEYGVGKYKMESFDRKPNPGMILRAKDDLGLLLDASVLVGDKASDIDAARAANIGMAVLMAPSSIDIYPKPDVQADSLFEINDILFEQPEIY